MTSSENETAQRRGSPSRRRCCPRGTPRSGRSCRSRPAGSRWTRCCRSPTSSTRRRARSRRPCCPGWPSSATSASPCRPSRAAWASASSSTAWSARSWPGPGCRRPASWPAPRAWAPRCADADRRHELLARSARGDWIGAIALSEPDAGSDLAGVSTRAVLDGDEWVVTGHKRWCGNAKAADFIQVLVRERDPEEGESRSAGLVNLLLEKKRGEFPEGLTGHPIDKVGYHGFLTWDLQFDGVRIPKDNVIDQARAAQEESAEEGEAAEAGRVRRGAEVPQHRPRAHRRPRRRPGPGRAGGLDPLPAGARAVRPPDRRLPGAALQRRRDGRADRAVPHLLPPGGAPARPRPARAPRRPRW